MSHEIEHQAASFSELIAASRSRLFGYIYAMLQNMSDAEDVYQQTTVLLWEKFAEFEPGTNFTGWALRVANYNIQNFRRSRGRSRVFFSDTVMEKVAVCMERSSDDLADARTEALIYCLGQLPEEKRKLLSMRYSEGFPLRKLAQLEKKSEAAISMVLVRIRKELMGCINARLAAGEAD